jgi:pyridoxal phosphate enzyme (YggS family)
MDGKCWEGIREMSEITDPVTYWQEHLGFHILSDNTQLTYNMKNGFLSDFMYHDVTVVAVSKTKTKEEILKVYDAGHRDFGENKAQELQLKYELLPKDIRWHMIGHLQTNKVKYIAPFVHLIHSVDSEKLLKVIDKEAKKNSRVIQVLLQVKIAREETKFGLDPDEMYRILEQYQAGEFSNIRICGLMGMASLTEDTQVVNKEFASLHDLFIELKEVYFNRAYYFRELSMGMSGDYQQAIEHGATIIRIGTLIFGERH